MFGRVNLFTRRAAAQVKVSKTGRNVVQKRKGHSTTTNPKEDPNSPEYDPTEPTDPNAPHGYWEEWKPEPFNPLKWLVGPDGSLVILFGGMGFMMYTLAYDFNHEKPFWGYPKGIHGPGEHGHGHEAH